MKRDIGAVEYAVVLEGLEQVSSCHRRHEGVDGDGYVDRDVQRWKNEKLLFVIKSQFTKKKFKVIHYY